MLCWWRSGLTIAGASRCPRGTSSRSTSTACCASGCRTRDGARVRARCRGSGWRPSTTRTCSERIRTGQMSVREQRGLGLPWSEVLVERGRRSVGGTARRGAAGAGARHRDEPRRRHPPRGPRLRPRLLPVQRRRGDVGAAALGGRWCGARSSSTATSTRATAPPSSSAPTPDAFTLSLHGARNYPFERIPSDLDVDLPQRHRRRRVPARARPSRSTSRSTRATPTSRSSSRAPTRGRATASAASSLTKAGLRARDELVLDRLLETGAAVVVVLAGGYAPDVVDTVDINAATVDAVAARDAS